ncbi:MAG: MFS transporter [bacterium]
MVLFKNIESWRKNLYIIWASQFIAMMGMSLVVPFLPFFIRSLGVTDPEDLTRWSGIVFSGVFLSAFFFTPVWGYLGDRYGRKSMTVRAIFGLALSQVLVGFSQSVEMLFFFRVVQGAISGFLAAALALVSANTPKEKSGYAIGLLQTATAGGNVIGPLIGGSLADLVGYRPIFFIVGGLCTITGIIIIKYVEEFNKVEVNNKPKHSLWSNYHYAFSSRPIRISLLLILISQMAVFLVQPIFPLFINSLLESSKLVATTTGAIFSITGAAMVISSPWWGKRNDRKSYTSNLTYAFLGAAISFILQGLVTNVYHLLILRALFGFCLGGMLPALYSYVNKSTVLERRGGIMGIAASISILATLIASPMGGVIGAGLGIRPVFFIGSILLFLSTFFLRTLFIDLTADDLETDIRETLDQTTVEQL